ncbi:MAG: glycosyltransferase [Anaerolineales bacterium]|nr:glycosyltransferase [Anaerolineales bacterium]
MTRIGINPARGKRSDYRPESITLAVLTYIPDLSGYFEHRLQVLKLVFASLLAHTSLPYDLLVFDNGSCPAVVDTLLDMQRAGHIDYLIRARQNIGKIDALRILFNAAPGEIIAYNDDDILFYPGWLEAHLDILKRFPNVGMVSGVPVRNAANHARRSLDALSKETSPRLRVLQERRIPDEWEIDWAASTGRDADKHLAETRAQTDLVLQYEIDENHRLEAIGSANHFQFVTPKEVIVQALPCDWTGKLMGHMVELDEAIDNLGYLRLSTIKRYTRHLGNALSDDAEREARSLGLLDGEQVQLAARKARKRPWLLRIPGSRRALSAIYKRLFDILYR